MSFGSRDQHSLTVQCRKIKEMQKTVKSRLKQEEEEKDLVEQKDLVLLKERQQNQTAHLRDVVMRPSLAKGKCIGNLRAHKNGFRFHSSQGQKIDVIYSNIEHFLYQPSHRVSMVLIHMKLKNPIMVRLVSGVICCIYIIQYANVCVFIPYIDNGKYSISYTMIRGDIVYHIQ